MKIVYFDCSIGASGDMILSSLVDLGVPLDVIQETINKLIEGKNKVRLSVERVKRQNISALSLNISVEGGHNHSISYKRMREILEKGELKEKIKKDSLAILHKLASAEADIHAVDVEDVHFHELGGLDTIVDIVGVATALDFLGVEKVYASSLPLSYGFIEIEHGTLPLPAPATLKLLEGVPVRSIDIEGETLTPTGAAIITYYAKSYGIPNMRLLKIGMGAGHKDFPLPNILRTLLGEKCSDFGKEEVIHLQTNIDDMPPTLFEPIIDKLFSEGALDVFLQPIIMKRSRPAVILSVLCYPQNAEKLAEIIFKETTTLGIRFNRLERAILEREIVKVKTIWGEVEVKVGKLEGKVITISPELRSCEKIAETHGIPLRIVVEEVKRVYRRTFDLGE
ncbi:nickel pincer cofactor biosynthesis protein LarC [bacterium]|nr:nickel pincer cofactor biosynthesis protein LarC [bacterium]